MSNSIPNQIESGSTGPARSDSVGVENTHRERSTELAAMQITPLAQALDPISPLTLRSYRGVESVSNFSNSDEELAALLSSAGVYDLGWRRHIRCTGEDRVRWLNGMVTNSVGNLEEHAGCYAFVLNAQGRIQGDLDIYRRPDSFWLETDASQVEALTAFLDHYIIMDDVTLELQSRWTALGIAGPQAAASISQAGLPIPTSPLHFSETSWQGKDVVVIAANSPLVPRYEILIERESVREMWNTLRQGGASPCGVDAVESLRVLEGTPAYSIDIAAKDLPQETNQIRALHFNKGCYLGQEIVERIHSRGNVHRTFTGFVLADANPAPGTALVADGKPVGEITSVASVRVPGIGERVVALGSIRREALERNSALMAGQTVAHSSSLPFNFSNVAGRP
ncbi:MAG: folate-binding protein [Acidobacteriota bacterium]